MIYGSVCSGIEAATVAWHPLGWRPAFFSEIEAFPRAVLAHRYPTVPLHGDFTTIPEHLYEPIDLLVGGTPCQSFSVAGLRGGLADDRGNLALEFLRLAQRLSPRWLVWENVPGVFSSLSHDAPDPCPPPLPMDLGCDGAEVETEDEYHSEELHAFRCFLAGLSELGYGWSYRVLDAQYAGVPQRRRRVFVVGYLGDWRRAAAVLFERHSLSWDTPPRREAGKRLAPTLSARTKGGGGLGTDFDLDGGMIASTGDLSHCLNAGGMGRQDYETETLIAHSLRAEGFDASEDGTGRGTPLVPVSYRTFGDGAVFEEGDVTAPLTTQTDKSSQIITQPYTLAIRGRGDSHELEYRQDGTANALLTPNGGRGGIGVGAIAESMAVRRLTPRECARLQGFPDDYLDITFRGKPAADGPKYKALGNSMAVPCMRWIGERIAMVDALALAERAA